KLQYEPVLKNQSLFRRIPRYTGQVNRSGITCLARNVFFEPFSDPDKDWVDSCLAQVSLAFTWNQPAVVSCHRVNFIGSLSADHRNRNLRRLKQLLSKAVIRWPDLEFINTSELLNLI